MLQKALYYLLATAQAIGGGGPEVPVYESMILQQNTFYRDPNGCIAEARY
jgi:hypothetical protein